MESFKKWMESTDQSRQKDKASFAMEKPTTKNAEMSRYGFMKKKCKPR